MYKLITKLILGDTFFISCWTLFCVVCFRIFSKYVLWWYLEGAKKTAFQIWGLKGQHNSILIFILTENIWIMQNEKHKYALAEVVFDFYDCNCAYTWIQIWWNCNMLYFTIQLNYVVKFEFGKSSSNLKPALNKSLKKKHLKEPFSEWIKTKIKSKQTMK